MGEHKNKLSRSNISVTLCKTNIKIAFIDK